MRHIPALVAIFLVAICPPARSVASADLPDYRLTLGGLGPLRNGMSATEVRRAGFRFKVRDFGNVDECAQVDILGQKDVGLMFEDGRVVRIEIFSNKIPSLRGVRIGNTEEEVKSIYGSALVIEPHQYDPEGHYLKVFSKDKQSSMVFETDGRVVTDMRAGPGAEYVEGCL